MQTLNSIKTGTFMEFVRNIHNIAQLRLTSCSMLIDLGVRLYIADVFFKSGLNKYQSFDTTILLFQNEYHVPVLPPEIAAYTGTFIEMFFPILLAIGLATRYTALVLFVFNVIAVVSYPDLNPNGLEQHIVWGIMLLVTMLHGPGKLSFDFLIRK